MKANRDYDSSVDHFFSSRQQLRKTLKKDDKIAQLVRDADPGSFVQSRVAKEFLDPRDGMLVFFGTVTEFDDSESPTRWRIWYDDDNESLCSFHFSYLNLTFSYDDDDQEDVDRDELTKMFKLYKSMKKRDKKKCPSESSKKVADRERVWRGEDAG